MLAQYIHKQRNRLERLCGLPSTDHWHPMATAAVMAITINRRGSTFCEALKICCNPSDSGLCYASFTQTEPFSETLKVNRHNKTVLPNENFNWQLSGFVKWCCAS